MHKEKRDSFFKKSIYFARGVFLLPKSRFSSLIASSAKTKKEFLGNVFCRHMKNNETFF